MDLDIQFTAVATLKKNVEKLFKDQLLISQLNSKGLEIARFSNPKNTELTQRWKLSLRNIKSRVEINTKIEFSRRGGVDEGLEISPPTEMVLNQHNLPKFPIPHYDKDRAFAQKIGALVGRSEPQERDLLDIDVLLNLGAKLPISEKIDNSELERASETIIEMDFDRYMSKVIAYLTEEHREYYGTREVWEKIQERVLTAIEAVAR
jgi:hypothetical protein